MKTQTKAVRRQIIKVACRAALLTAGTAQALSWQDILDARGYVIIVPFEHDRVDIGVPIGWTVTGFEALPPGSLVPIMQTTYADFLEQAKMYPGEFWCGEKDRYYRCIAE
jgi:hypothetical protein